MYIPPGITLPKFWAMVRAGASHKTQTVTAQIHSINSPDDEPLSIKLQLLDGEIDIVGNGRSISATFWDPRRRLHRIEGINAAKYILRINVSIYVEELDETITFPGATMALDTCTRTDKVVTITGSSKASLHMGEIVDPFTIPAGTLITEAIMIVAQHAGELRSHIDLPHRPARLGHDYKVGDRPEELLSTHWHHENLLARELGLILFYNQGGHLVGRPPATSSSFTFRTGLGGYLITMPSVPVEYRDFHNRVRLKYGHGLKREVVLDAPDSYELSAEERKWNGKRRVNTLKLERPHTKDERTALRLCRIALDREVLHVTQATAESYRFWWLEASDLYKFNSRDYLDKTTIPDSTIGLKSGRSQTLGWTDVRSRGVAL